MNIDIINKELSNELNINEKDIALVNKFYWDSISNHISSYSEFPVNISGICVIYPDKYLIKTKILQHIKIIKSIEISKKYKEDSEKKKEHIEMAKRYLRLYWKLRKKCKYTN